MANKNVTVKISGVKGIGDSTQKIIKQSINDKKTLVEAAKIIQKSVVGNARSGKDPDGKKFKELSSSWIERKSRLSKVNKTSKFYSKNRSNLTFTGQLLDSFVFKVNEFEASIHLFFEGNRRRYKGIVKSELDGVSTNKELAEKIEEDRPFVFLGDKTKNVLVNLIKRNIRQQLTNFRRLKRILR